MPLLEVKQAGVAYGDIQVLWDASIEVGAGESVALLGPNGSGKSTLMNSISGLRRLAAGAILFDGQPLHTLRPHQIPRCGLAHVLERYRLFPHMTVRENLELGATSRAGNVDLSASFDRVFDLFPRLKERLGQIAGSMSGGEQQMCAIGRGLMAAPKMLMVDEPFIGLSPQLRIEVAEALGRLNREGLALLLIEQNVRKALQMSNRVYVLRAGRVVLSGASTESGMLQRVEDVFLSGHGGDARSRDELHVNTTT